MKMSMKNYAKGVKNIGAALLVSGALCALIAAAPYVNPLKGDIGVHDPVMIKAGSTYYVFSTSGLIQKKTSTDRINWKNAGTALSTAPAWFKTDVPGNNGSETWAPDISFRNNQYWLYYSVSTFGSSVSAIGLATSTNMNTWTDQGRVIKSAANSNYNCIDPNAFTDTDGKVWLAFGSFWSGIKIVELDSITGKPKNANPTVTAIAQHVAGIEAPFIMKWGSYYYLFVSWDACCKGVSSTYKIVVGRSTRVDSGYIDKTGKNMLQEGGFVLDAGDAVRKGPGHNGIFIEHDTAFCVNHYYDATDNGNSKLQIRPLYWDTGWPAFTGTKTSQDVHTIARANNPTQQNAARIRTVFASSLSRINTSGKKVYSVLGKQISIIDKQGTITPNAGAGIVIIDNH